MPAQDAWIVTLLLIGVFCLIAAFLIGREP